MKAASSNCSAYSLLAILGASTTLVACSPTTEPVPPAKPAYSGPTFAFSEADVVDRMAKVAPDFPSQANERFKHEEGLDCSQRVAVGGDWIICSAPNGQVRHVAYHVAGGREREALLVNRQAVDAMMAASSAEPYTAKDSKRIHDEVQAEVLAQRSVVEQADRPKFVFMGTYPVRVQTAGSSYDLLMQAGLEPH